MSGKTEKRNDVKWLAYHVTYLTEVQTPVDP